MSLDRSESVRQLMSRRREISRSMEMLHIEKRRIELQLAEAHREMKAVKREIEALTRDKREVTDHAVLRYLQRVRGVDIEAVREEIRACDHRDLINFCQPGTAKLPIIAGCHLVVEDGVIVTVLAPKEEMRK